MSRSASPIIVMTGATSGIGRLAAIELARRGAHLVLIARSEPAAAATRNAIEASVPQARIDVHFADLADLASVTTVGQALVARHERIDVLVNNAGIHAFSPRATVDGHDEMMAVNYLAPWLLTDILRETLVRSAPSRIVTTASEASRRHGTLRLDQDMFVSGHFSRLGSSEIYGRSKLLDIMFSLELARQLEGTGVAVNCLDPGFNVTGLGRELSFAPLLERVLTRLGIGDPGRGAGIIVRLADDAEFAGVTGGYFSVKGARPLRPVPPADDEGARLALWEITREVLADRL
ncbi:NAD(P)-dependent dehydrogenase (short-subunit alcohol dehydrogenase family) [Sphingomonas kyeonggiensis]|uniref:NAD(P)-dependent dehydrogenase (Short-subunit alcohol dehydrogenase family) n=1 Tax=Sphingomonas kyeonggiensis TaxID=1268553 RepID=A0A7W7JYA9_9SPHN|nr:SDR family NAD(P)-dependent oxidoreductase [Sphingomonas kyeonggiensis]MBB4836995.1 NAD(P)-dependent dehydrogenase (short-subunit alcohol dehydrogenase family) [Sphingomonas kyeonggiensis]